MLTYTVDLAEIDRLRAEHIAWLRQSLDSGRLFLAGRKVPVTGGMFLARGSLDEVQAWCASDPFAIAGAADYQFTQIAPTIVAPGLEALAT